MAEAQLYDGVALVGYVNGKPVDANGELVKGAPPQPPDTDPSQQPHGMAALNSEERSAAILANAFASALKGGALAGVAPTEEPDSDEGQAFTLEDLPAHLATLTTVEDVRAARKGDTRKGAKPLYEARIAELKGEG